MGLDLTAYSKVKLVLAENADNKDTLYDIVEEIGDGDFTILHVCNDFPLHEEGLVSGIYSYHKSKGCCAGSYTGYNVLREAWAKICDYKPEPFSANKPYTRGCWNNTNKEAPLWYLINYSDCEGVINTEICQKISEDFRELLYSGKFDVLDDYHLDKTKEIYNLFEFAARNEGVVKFH